MPRLNIFSFPILGEDFTGGIDDKTSGDSDDPNLKDVPKITETTKVMPLKIKRGQISGSITTPSPILQRGIDDETSADLDDTMSSISFQSADSSDYVYYTNPAENPMQISEQDILHAIKGKKCNKCDEILNMTNGKMLRHFTSKHFR